MTSELQFLAVLALLFITLVYYLGLTKKPEPKKQTEPKTKTTSIKKPRSAEVIDTLDWMLEHSIIDTNEYNKLLVKSLPFIE